MGSAKIRSRARRQHPFINQDTRGITGEIISNSDISRAKIQIVNSGSIPPPTSHIHKSPISLIVSSGHLQNVTIGKEQFGGSFRNCGQQSDKERKKNCGNRSATGIRVFFFHSMISTFHTSNTQQSIKLANADGYHHGNVGCEVRFKNGTSRTTRSRNYSRTAKKCLISRIHSARHFPCVNAGGKCNAKAVSHSCNIHFVS